MKQLVIIKLLVVKVLIYLNLSTILAVDLTVKSAKYVGKDSKAGISCVLTDFDVTITIKPSDQTFNKSTYKNLTPEKSIGQLASCKPEATDTSYRFNSTFDDNSVFQELLTVGIETGSSNSAEIYVNYIQVHCSHPKACLKRNLNYCSPKLNSLEQLKAKKCLRTSVMHTIAWLKSGQTYQCSHFSTKNLKDIGYVNEIAELKATFELDIHYIRIDLTKSTEQFHPIQYCPLDWVLDPMIILIVSSILCLIFVLIVIKCLLNCFRRRRKSNITGDNIRFNCETEKLGTPVEL